MVALSPGQLGHEREGASDPGSGPHGSEQREALVTEPHRVLEVALREVDMPETREGLGSTDLIILRLEESQALVVAVGCSLVIARRRAHVPEVAERPCD